MKALPFLFLALSTIAGFSQNLSTINPSSASAGQTLDVTITGANTHFSMGSGTTLDFSFNQGSGTSAVNSLNILSDISMLANITVPATTYTGDYNVNVFNAIDGFLFLNNAFHVNGQTPPSLASVSPDNAIAGQTLNVTITGANTHFSQGSGTTINFEFNQGSGTVVNSLNIVSNTSLLASITVPSLTVDGDYDVFVFSSVDGNLVLPGGFHVGSSGIVINSENDLSFTVYPNPAEDIITLLTRHTALLNKPLLFLYDLDGKLLRQQFIIKERTVMDISRLEKGTYLLELIYPDSKEVKRIVKD
ncbi:MAG: T9SS type A sorting domain-containing protein [Bacteroidetes bacterium]|nr:T9SS type A sorting domain-containing protein [Bacteroidota bacterium]